MRKVDGDVLIDDLRKMIEDTERLLRASAGNAAEAVAKARIRAEQSLEAARKRFGYSEQRIAARARAAARSADRYVHANPWGTIGAVAGIAFLSGYLMTRR